MEEWRDFVGYGQYLEKKYYFKHKFEFTDRSL